MSCLQCTGYGEHCVYNSCSDSQELRETYWLYSIAFAPFERVIRVGKNSFQSETGCIIIVYPDLLSICYCNTSLRAHNPYPEIAAYQQYDEDGRIVVEIHCVDGKIHRDDGPAIVVYKEDSIHKYFYLHGKVIRKEEGGNQWPDCL